VWEKIVSLFRKTTTCVSHEFVRLFGEEEAEKFAKASEGILRSALGTIVMTCVKAVQTGANPKTSNSDLRKQAFDAIVKAIETNGIKAAESLINMLIELALQVLKGKIG
jgi:hypothetical protein